MKFLQTSEAKCFSADFFMIWVSTARAISSNFKNRQVVNLDNTYVKYLDGK